MAGGTARALRDHGAAGGPVEGSPARVPRLGARDQDGAGDWDIPVPPPEAARVSPAVILAPLVGWDGSGYRLGYGGGHFDRTLAALSPRPYVIGVGLQQARLATIYPQPHDVRLDAIVTEAGVQVLAKP